MPPLGRPNMVAISGMAAKDLFELREYYIVKLVQAHRAHDSDTVVVCLDWISALVSEMRMRGGRPTAAPSVIA